MAVAPFLAMTAAEICGSSSFPPKIGWMACHFSPYSVGLSNLPRNLPEGSLLILNDITPIHGHDPEVVARQLTKCAEYFRCSALLLDFQREDCEEAKRMAAHLVDALPCPVAVSQCYADGLPCPVFLSPLPHHIPLTEWIIPWAGREIWLEVAMDGEEILVTDSGSFLTSLPHFCEEGGQRDDTLYCHYRVELAEDTARFTLWRTREDIHNLLEAAESMNITTAVGLYQEFRKINV